MGQLDGKVAVVTGASKGIGFATAQRFAEEGATVYLTGRGKTALDSAVAQIGPRAIGVPGDVSDLAALDQLFATIEADGQRIDVLFANAGMTAFVPLANVTEEHYEQVTGLNVRGTLFTVQKALPFLNDNASIILASSTTAARGPATGTVYAASKAAVRSFARTWANELKDRGIRVNALAPGGTETPAMVGATPEGLTAEEFRGMVAAQVPMGRVSQPEEQAAAALFLASGQSSYITGIELLVDGGINSI
ncbi:SDR family oxidoreductase [Streptomyces sp. SID13031]|uniref:SDR family NAD(P)-dependent oxidoreductase n=1 Tax=Streptomyces sp. SID13031 TaxID=2706046 RepID=UPI0013C8EE3E|nr:SDR family oxidoreductase [Streptomyces sp. SID13031]NEA34440.1 SDR family oxidoreductase [Streptomyces sp. SID13031]